jgi:hypothetical protein
MAFQINTHDSWGVVTVARFQTLEEARQAFRAICGDPWYRQDGTVKGVELVDETTVGVKKRLDWFAFH